MDHLAIKYRPKKWKDVLGQEATVTSLRKALKSGTARSFILVGPSGVGKTTLARLAAKQLECRDVHEIDAATRTGVDGVRELTELIRYKPVGGKTRVLILDEAHMLSKQAWNALLKAVEEPPAGVYWIFCTTEEGKIPKTIETRCQRYRLDEVGEDALFELVAQASEAEGFNLTDDIVDLCVSKAYGSPRQALSNLGTVSHCKTRQEAAAVLQEAPSESEAIDLCRSLAKGPTNWPELMKLVKRLQGPSESVRFVVLAYFEKVAMGSRSPEASLAILSAFSKPYPPGQSRAGIILSIGELLYGQEEEESDVPF